MKAIDDSSLARRFEKLQSVLNEKAKRLWAATEAIELGYGGVSTVSRATGLSRSTIANGIDELNAKSPTPADSDSDKQRKPGGGRKKKTDTDPEIKKALENLLEPYTSGDPVRALRWTCKSTANLAEELTKIGHPVSPRTVASLLKEMNYSLQSNRKRFEGKQHPDRNAQFEYINQMVNEFQKRGCPVISVDTKKKELVGNYKNAGQEWTESGHPQEVKAYDFIDPNKGKAIPYGVYDVTLNNGWVSVGADHDTAEFAVASIGQWWARMGEYHYPDANELLILADGGGSNGVRSRLWKYTLQKWADEESLKIAVCHFPPGTSKWNKIEHRMFCHITQNWRGKPLISHEVVVQLIGATTTKKGLKIDAGLDTATYPTGKKISDEQMDSVKIQRADFHGEWNYLISGNISQS